MSAPDALQATARDLDMLQTVATAAADAAADVVRSHRGSGPRVEWQLKGRADYATIVDHEAEERIRDVVARALPDARVVGEEQNPSAAAGAGLTFVVDPLDGTTNFLHDYPEYAVSVAVLLDRTPVVGVVVNVPLGHRYVAVSGRGATVDQRPIRVSEVADPARALIGTGFPFKYPEQIDRYVTELPTIMQSTAGIRRAGAAALDLCAVAAGRFDAFWEHSLEPWDFSAGALLVREAGGTITDLRGNTLALARSGVLAGNAAMHAWMLRTLSAA
ncbi:MAG: inositol monophosphatase family protein [Gemmatimonadaceae bacterium]